MGILDGHMKAEKSTILASGHSLRPINDPIYIWVEPNRQNGYLRLEVKEIEEIVQIRIHSIRETFGKGNKDQRFHVGLIGKEHFVTAWYNLKISKKVKAEFDRSLREDDFNSKLRA